MLKIDRIVTNKIYLLVVALFHLLLAQAFIYGRFLNPQVWWIIVILAVGHGFAFAYFLIKISKSAVPISPSLFSQWWNVIILWYAPPLVLISLALLQRESFLSVTFVGSIIAYAVAFVYAQKKPDKQLLLKPAPQTKEFKEASFGFLSKNALWIVAGAIILGVLLRIYFVFQGRIDGDEGNFLYDASHVLRGFIPNVDFKVRGLSYIVALASWLKLIGSETLLAARFFHVLLFVFTSIGLYLFSKNVWNTRIATIVTLLYALNPFSAYLSTILKTEPFQETTHIFVLLFFSYAVQQRKWWAFLGLAVFVPIDLLVRPSSLIFISSLVVFAIGLFAYKKYPQLIKQQYTPLALSGVIISGLTIAVSAVAISPYLKRLFSLLKYTQKLNFAGFSNKLEDTIANMMSIISSILFLESFAILALGVLGLLLIHKHVYLRKTLVGIFLAWGVLSVGTFLIDPGYDLARLSMYLLIISVLVASFWWLVYLIQAKKITFSTQTKAGISLTAIVTYMTVLLSFYMLFKRFQVSYTVEFLLPFHLVAGYVTAKLYSYKQLRLPLVLMIVLSFASVLIVVAGPSQDESLVVDHHFRRHSIETVSKVTDIIATKVAPGQEIFSGNTIFAANSNLRLAMDLSHPQFDYYDFPTKKKREKLLSYLTDNNIQYAIYDYKMEFFFYKKNPAIKKYIDNKYSTIYYDAENDIRILERIQ